LYYETIGQKKTPSLKAMKGDVVPTGIPACRQAGNLYQKFRKLLFTKKEAGFASLCSPDRNPCLTAGREPVSKV